MTTQTPPGQHVPPRLIELSLENFKGFGPEQRIPIRPITLIFGGNSSGKSSILHALGIVSHLAAGGNLDSDVIRIGAQELRLGTIFGLQHGHSDKPIRIACEVELAAARSGLAEAKRIRVAIGYAYVFARGDTDYDALVASGFADASFTLDGQFLMSTVADADHELPVAVPYASRLHLSAVNEVSRHWGWMPAGSRGDAWNSIDGALGKCSVVERFWPLIELRSDEATPLERQVAAVLVGLVNASSRAVRDALRPLTYLGSIRPVPQRWQSAGDLDGTVWSTMVRDPRALREVNEWLGRMSYHLGVDPMLRKDAIAPILAYILERYEAARQGVRSSSGEDDPFPGSTILGGAALYTDAIFDEGRSDASSMKSSIRASLERAGLEEQRVAWPDLRRAIDDVDNALARTPGVLSNFRSLALFDSRTGIPLSFNDVGAGVSQVVPVVAAAYGSRNRIIAVEQPELHLHPALQADLMDVFIESAVGERRNTLVLETHSEHLILRLLKRIRQTTEGTLPEGVKSVTPDDVAILYVSREQPGDDASVDRRGAHVERIDVTDDGQFATPWPSGFFGERLQELL